MPLTARSVHNHQLLPHIFHTSPQNIAKIQPPCATCMIMLFKCPIANKIQRSPFQYKWKTGNPCFSATTLRGRFQLGSLPNDPPLPTTSTFSHHASRKGGVSSVHPRLLGICWPFWVESKKFFTPIATISYSPETWCASVTGWVEVTGGWIGELPGTVRGHL